MPDNMRIWKAVEKTDPNYTKEVKQRGGFTAIDAQYQIMMATEQFGPIGIGWGYTTEKLERLDQFVVAHVTIWHGERCNTFGPVLGCSEMFGNRPDSDAPKKATTDAITKGLSQLGFNADVFLKKFDDSKYVEQRRKDVEKEKRPKPVELKSKLLALVKSRKTAGGLAALQAHKGFDADWNDLMKRDPEAGAEITAAINDKQAELEAA